jgi:hypothetical protein
MAEEVVITPEEKAAIDKDLADAKASLVSKATQEQLDRAKAEAEKELQLKKQLEEAEKEKKILADKIAAQEKETAERLSKLQSKVDELVTSKAPATIVDPFKSTNDGLKGQIASWNDDQVDAFEEASAREFFGDDYDARE